MYHFKPRQLIELILIWLLFDMFDNQNRLCWTQQNGEQVILNNLRKGQDTKNQIDELNQLLKIQFVNVNGSPVLVQFTYSGPPKILPIATADSYPEGSTINLICTVSGGQRKGLELLWNINGDQIDDGKLKYQTADYPNVSLDSSDSDISIMKIRNATINNSGQYTCTAKNPHGEDSTSVKIVINGKFLNK